MKTFTDELVFPEGSGGYKFQMTNYRKLSRTVHDHTFYELIYVVSGQVSHIINDTELSMGRHSAVILVPGDSHLFDSQSEDASLAVISFSSAEAEKFISLYGNVFDRKGKLPALLKIGEADAVDLNHICENIKGLMDEQSLLYVKILLGKFVHLKASGVQEREMLPKGLAEALEKYCSPEHISEDVEALERFSGYSKTHLTRLMKKHLNTTVHEYIKNRRLALAYELIVSTDKSFEEISESVGYNSFSYFYRIFTDKFKVSPSNLRKSELMSI